MINRDNITSKFTLSRASALVAVFALAGVAALTTSCTKAAPQAPPHDGYIHLRASVLEHIDPTKAAASAATEHATKAATKYATGEEIPSVMFFKSEGENQSWDFTATTTGKISAAGDVTYDSNPFKYNTSNTLHSWIVACAPATTVESDGMIVWAIDGKTDVLCSGNDFFDAGTVDNPTTGSGIKLLHMLSRLQVICKASNNDTYADITAAWGTITKIELMDVASKVEVATDDFTSASREPAINIPLFNASYGTFTPVTIQESAATDVIVAAAISGKTFSDNSSSDIWLKITGSTGKTATIVVKSTDQGFGNSGYSFNVTLQFTTKDVKAKATVGAWATGSTINKDV